MRNLSMKNPGIGPHSIREALQGAGFGNPSTSKRAKDKAKCAACKHPSYSETESPKNEIKKKTRELPNQTLRGEMDLIN